MTPREQILSSLRQPKALEWTQIDQEHWQTPQGMVHLHHDKRVVRLSFPNQQRFLIASALYLPAVGPLKSLQQAASYQTMIGRVSKIIADLLMEHDTPAGYILIERQKITSQKDSIDLEENAGSMLGFLLDHASIAFPAIEHIPAMITILSQGLFYWPNTAHERLAGLVDPIRFWHRRHYLLYAASFPTSPDEGS